MQWLFKKVLPLNRCASVVQTGVGSPAIHAAARSNPGQWDEDERSHEHKTAPLLTPPFILAGVKPLHVSKMLFTVCFLLLRPLNMSHSFYSLLAFKEVKDHKWGQSSKIYFYWPSVYILYTALMLFTSLMFVLVLLVWRLLFALSQ